MLLSSILQILGGWLDSKFLKNLFALYPHLFHKFWKSWGSQRFVKKGETKIKIVNIHINLSIHLFLLIMKQGQISFFYYAFLMDYSIVLVKKMYRIDKCADTIWTPFFIVNNNPTFLMGYSRGEGLPSSVL